MRTRSADPIDQFPDEEHDPLLPCPQCQNLSTPTMMLARRTSDSTGIRHYGLVGCEHAREVGMWNFPPHGFTPSRKSLSVAWNEQVAKHNA